MSRCQTAESRELFLIERVIILCTMRKNSNVSCFRAFSGSKCRFWFFFFLVYNGILLERDFRAFFLNEMYAIFGMCHSKRNRRSRKGKKSNRDEKKSCARIARAKKRCISFLASLKRVLFGTFPDVKRSDSRPTETCVTFQNVSRI